MRVRNKPWAKEYIEENDKIVTINPYEIKGKWQEHFKNDHPIHLEIGTGKGQFIAGMAERYPHINFIGIEQSESVIVNAIDKVKDSKVSNVQLINENARDLREMFSQDEIRTIYLNFSDPWPKNRHEKRRLTYRDFLEQYKEVLDHEGKLILKTDNQHLFEYSLVSFSKFNMKLEDVTLNLHALQEKTNVMTEYEEKFSKKGQPIYRCIARFN
ncbi:tRNA (guanosine(46)-N7)-methyltransferase TrmB [Bacillaceae bacterium W0354]